MFSIVFEPCGCTIRAASGTTILKAAEEAGVRIRSDCGGKGICGKCRVAIRNQLGLEALSQTEAELLTVEEVQLGYRLACRSRVLHPSEKLTVVIPEESSLGERKFQETGIEVYVPLEPAVTKYFISLSKPTLEDFRPDLERLLDSLMIEHHFESLDIDYQLLRSLPKLLREANWNATSVIWNKKKIISIETGDTTNDILGLAVDLGTSKIVAQLVDLTTGETIAVATVDNPQIAWGENIISRISFADGDEENLRILQDMVVSGVNETINRLCSETGRSSSVIYEAVVVGNTVMHHLFLGIEPTYLGLSPFIPSTKRSVNVKACELKVNMNSAGIVNVLPVVAGFVGADAVADLMASGIYNADEATLLIDIGTNTEVFVSSSREVLSCSCASGPAFEGGHISQGMKAMTGAIEKVRIEERTYKVYFDTIGNTKPTGLCGSGIIDAVAEMFRCKIIDRLGRFNRSIETPRLRESGSKMEFVIAWEDEGGVGRDISISEKDISEILLAKAAIFASSSVLMKRRSVSLNDLKKVLIAGALGTNTSPESAKIIGLIPDVPLERIGLLGNSAIVGAKMALVSKSMREEAELVSQRVTYIELTTDPDFSKEFSDALYLPNRDINRFPSVKKALGELKEEIAGAS